MIQRYPGARPALVLALGTAAVVTGSGAGRKARRASAV
jgi:hypothetical protein